MTLAIGVALILVAVGFGAAGNIAMASATGFFGLVLYISSMLAEKEKKDKKRGKHKATNF